jgi:hypothetical protein
MNIQLVFQREQLGCTSEVFKLKNPMKSGWW